MSEKSLKTLVIFESLKVGPVKLTPKKVSAIYTVTKKNGEISENEFTYTYEESVFDVDKATIKNLASLMMAQVALNYGLFCEKIIFDGLYDNTDRWFLKAMMENTSREIYVNKFLMPNPFLLEEVKGLPVEKKNRYTAASVVFENTAFPNEKLDWDHWEVDKNRHAILSSGGKDSLLTYGLLKELGKNPVPIFVNESGRHWFTAINAYRHFKETENNTARVWCNSDRIFNWMLRNMSFIRKDFANVRADDYPIRLWTVAVFLFGVIPVALKQKAGRLVIGDEYDSTQKTSYQGITHYNALYDQSRYFDNVLSRYFMKKGWNFSQFSILRSLSELLIIKILTKRYPNLQQHQVSCHASHEENGRIYPCGNCEKCRRIVGMLLAVDEDPKRCGYDEKKIQSALKSLSAHKIKQIGSDAAHLYYMLLDKKLIEKTEHTQKLGKPHPYILKMRFDQERSRIKDIPLDLRKPLFSIYNEYTDGAVRLVDRKWVDFDIISDEEILQPYPFEIKFSNSDNLGEENWHKKDYLWGELTWPEIQERLKTIDTAILPCGSIEQHGKHLPVDLDYFDADYLAKRVAEACSKPRPFVLPSIPYGVSYHHDDFKGTLSVSNESLSRFVYDIGMNLAKSGIKKLVILNGHGDNAPTLNFAAQMINRDSGIFVCVDTGESSDEDIYKEIDTPNDIHAGEVETSTALAIRPHLVRMDQAADITVKFENPYLDFSSARGVPWYVRTKLISKTGVIGNPLKASVEKGEKIWDIMVAHLVKFIEELKNTDPETLHQRKY
ncbi:MAG: creatininase family protein [Bacteroidales bacterium]|nr:creatininase family protein [Bacteroidales bacterium]